VQCSTIRTPLGLAKLAFISCCYRGTSPPNRSAVAADRASSASSWLIWLASRAARAQKRKYDNLRAFVLIIKPLIPASCLQCFVSILCFNQNQTPTPIHPGIGGSPQPHETPSLRADHRLTQAAGSRHQPREFHNLFSSLLAALLRQAHSSFLLFL
jgi:hypothetical protein